MDFCHLHVHSDYSLLDGTAPVDDLVRTAKERGLSTLALTDHGSMSGAIAFYKAGKKHGVKPILGLETYMAPGARTDRKKDPVTGVSSFHLTLLARTLEGYHNLMALSSAAYTEGFYYNPRIDKELLAAHAGGLIVLSGCFKGETSWHLRNGARDKAYETAEWYRHVFGENYFVEIQRNGTEGQEPNNQDLAKMARELKIPLVCTNDVHYVSRDDARAQEVRMAISTGKTLDDEERLKHKTSDFFLRDGAEMNDLFRDFPEAFANTLEIAKRCDVVLPFGKFHLPHFAPPEGRTPTEHFRGLCRAGLVERYGDPPPLSATQRLDYEMGVIEKMGFTSYFLIVWDFIRYAREKGVPVGPGRGSAAGSIVAYSLRITDVCPLKHDLLFERFLNSERISMPDIDIDFCRDGRAEVIRYVTEKYGGSANVSQIITFGTMAARAVLRDVGRAMNVPLADIDVIAKKVPGGPGVTLGASIDADPDLKTLRDDPRYKELFDVSLKLEGLNRHASTHAAGVVVGDGPLNRHVPLAVVAAGGDVVTQYTMEHLEDIGLLKMDFLGLKTLTVLDKAVKLLASSGVAIDLAHLPENDGKTYRLLARGEAVGVFQLESGGMRDLLVRLKPDRFEDLIAILALYRPGPLQTGMVDQFVDRKHGREEVRYLHPALEPLLKDTYGTFVYQEQIMLIAQRLAGFSLNEADGLRKAMGKKKLDQMLKYKTQFVDGCTKNSVAGEIATQVWDVMERFAEYAFNKSHTTAYAVLTYQTAYLKANHPVEFMAALMTCDMGATDKLVPLIDECRRMGLAVLPPDVERSGVDFTVEDAAAARDDRRAIRFGLAAVKGVGETAAGAIVEARTKSGGRFPSLEGFCEAVDLARVNRATLEALVRGGALDAFGSHRAQVLAGLEPCLKMAAATQEDKKAGQMSLFGGGAPVADAVSDVTTSRGAALPDVERWPETQMLAYEKESLGIYMSSHPLAKHERTLLAFATHRREAVAEAGTGARVRIAGMVAHLKTQFPKTGRNVNRKFARFRMEEWGGGVSCVMFADQYEEAQAVLVNEAIGFVEGTLDLTREEPDIKVDRFVLVERAFEELAEALVVVPPPGEEARVVPIVQRIARDFSGKTPILLEFSPVPGVRARYRVESGGARACRELHEFVVAELGAEALRWKSKKVAPGKQASRAWSE
jgi:DNA polymerase-3 subunit alpha